MTVAIVILLAVLTIELGVLIWALARPVLALGRAAQAGANIAEALEAFVDRITGPSPIEELGAKFGDAMRAARNSEEGPR